MELHVWWAFFTGTVLICGAPGPNMLQVMATSAQYGYRHAFPAMMGCFLPVFFYICLSLLGAGALISMFPAAFTALQYAGAAYLLYLGIQAWRTPPSSRKAGKTPPKNMFRKSLLVGISNPKAIVFALAYFPQFLNPAMPQIPQCIILLGTFSVVEIAWYGVYSLGGGHLMTVLKKEKMQIMFNRLTGSLFLLFSFLIVAKART